MSDASESSKKKLRGGPPEATPPVAADDERRPTATAAKAGHPSTQQRATLTRRAAPAAAGGSLARGPPPNASVSQLYCPQCRWATGSLNMLVCHVRSCQANIIHRLRCELPNDYGTWWCHLAEEEEEEDAFLRSTQTATCHSSRKRSRSPSGVHQDSRTTAPNGPAAPHPSYLGERWSVEQIEAEPVVDFAPRRPEPHENGATKETTSSGCDLGVAPGRPTGRVRRLPVVVRVFDQH